MPDKTINVAVAANQDYLVGMLVTAGSICRSASQDVELKIHALDGGIADGSFQGMERKLKSLHPHVSVHRIRVDESLFSPLPDWRGNRMAYARLLLADALPEVDCIIYSDCDFLWHADIAELWSLCSPDVIFMSVKDCDATIEAEKKWFESKGLPLDGDKYFCTGLCVMNLKMFREEHILNKVHKFCCDFPDVVMPDQAALNHILRGRAKLVDEKWQTLSLCLTAEKAAKPVVIHYAGDIPWTRGDYSHYPLSDAHLLWFKELSLIDGISVYQALRRYYSRWQICYKRLLSKIVNWPVAGCAFKWLLDTSGRKGYYEDIKKFSAQLRR